MNSQFDIALDSLASREAMAPSAAVLQNADSAPTPLADRRASGAAAGKRFFIETFGCQMNVHDSEKVAGVLLDRGYTAAPNPAEADLMLYNTCSIREKAAQKVFSRLGEWRGVSKNKIIGVLGCLAQQEGEDIFERAPWVSLVCGSASYRKLPELDRRDRIGRPPRDGPRSRYR